HDALPILISQRADVIVFEMLTGKIVVIIAEWSVDLEDSLNPLRSTLRPERYLGYAGLGATTISRTVPVGAFHFSELPLHGRSAYKTITHSSPKSKKSNNLPSDLTLSAFSTSARVDRNGVMPCHSLDDQSRTIPWNDEQGLGAGASPRGLIQAKAQMPGTACAVMPSLPRSC